MVKHYLCLSCGVVDQPRLENRGSSAVEVALWLLIIPGCLYTSWRLGRQDRYCWTCGAPYPVPADSPAARRYFGISDQAPTQASLRGEFGRRKSLSDGDPTSR